MWLLITFEVEIWERFWEFKKFISIIPLPNRSIILPIVFAAQNAALLETGRLVIKAVRDGSAKVTPSGLEPVNNQWIPLTPGRAVTMAIYLATPKERWMVSCTFWRYGYDAAVRSHPLPPDRLLKTTTQSQPNAKFYRSGTPILNPGKEISMKILQKDLIYLHKWRIATL